MAESPSFTIRCQLEICTGICSAPCSNGPVLARRRRKRSSGHEQTSSVELEALLEKRDHQTGLQIKQLPTRLDLEQAVLVVEREEIGKDKKNRLSLNFKLIEYNYELKHFNKKHRMRIVNDKFYCKIRS